MFGIGEAISAGTNIKIAREQMRFQERMANTAYQRQMADLRKAGLNPMLVAKLGGAQTPPGAALPVNMPNLGDPTSAIEAVKKRSETKTTRAQASNLRAQEASARAVAAATMQQAALHRQNTATSATQAAINEASVYNVNAQTDLKNAERHVQYQLENYWRNNAEKAAHDAEAAKLALPKLRTLADIERSKEGRVQTTTERWRKAWLGF